MPLLLLVLVESTAVNVAPPVAVMSLMVQHRSVGVPVAMEIVAVDPPDALINDTLPIPLPIAEREVIVVVAPLGNVIVLMPLLTVSKNELAFLVKVVYQAIKDEVR